MIRPLLELKDYPHGFIDLFQKLEAGKPLSTDQLNFISSHEKALSNSALDPVLRYYLWEHKLRPDKALPLELPHHHLSEENFHQVKHDIHLLLHNHLNHVDLEMSHEQFLEFKALGLHEIVFWHGNLLVPGTVFQQGSIPHKLYFQWGRMFGVIKFHLHVSGKTLEGKVFIYFEDMHERTLRECIHAYSEKLREQEKPEPKHLHLSEKPALPQEQAELHLNHSFSEK